MIRNTISSNNSFSIYLSKDSAGKVFIILRVNEITPDCSTLIPEIYTQLAILIKQMKLKIVSENIFGDINIYENLVTIRKKILTENNIFEEYPVTYIQGKSFYNNCLAGIQIIAVDTNENKNLISIIYKDEKPCGWSIKRNGLTLISLPKITGITKKQLNNDDRTIQISEMFDNAKRLLADQNATYKDVICTRIYLSDILSWYNDFNKIRNKKYIEFGLIPTNSESILSEQIYLPSSTGIQADNSEGAFAVMNVWALLKEKDSLVEIEHDNGTKQKSAYRYGSAFSRATIIREDKNETIFVSGTASINEKGESVYLENVREQIKKTYEVLEALLRNGGASINDICYATVFLKRQSDVEIYWEVAKELGLTGLPAIYVIADICREELLFEIDAIASIDK